MTLEERLLIVIGVVVWLVILFKPGPLPRWMHRSPLLMYSRNGLRVISTVWVAIVVLRFWG